MDPPDVPPGAAEAALVARWLPHPHYVHLVRHDTAAQALSWYRAIRTDQWYVLEGEISTDNDVEPDYQQVRWLEDLVHEHHSLWIQYFQQAHITPLTLSYEDFVRDYEGTVLQILGFLGVAEPRKVILAAPGLRKQRNTQSDQWLSQYHQVRERLSPLTTAIRWSAGLKRFIEDDPSGKWRPQDVSSRRCAEDEAPEPQSPEWPVTSSSC